MRTTVSRFSALTAAVVVAVAGAPLANAATDAPAPTRYVALGDSFSSGAGVLPYASEPNSANCSRSALNYPHVIAQRTGLALTDVSCSGAATADVQATQLSAVTADTDVVTLTIGGNDGSFFTGMLSACVQDGLSTLGFGSPCATKRGSTFVDKLPTTYTNVVATLKAIHAKAPNARVAIAGYPQVLPQRGRGCFASMPVAAGDLAYVNDAEKKLNDTVRRAAADTGSTYVDMWAASAGHDACQWVGTRWVEPLLWGLNTVPVHPNALGHKAYANAFVAALGL